MSDDRRVPGFVIIVSIAALVAAAAWVITRFATGEPPR